MDVPSSLYTFSASAPITRGMVTRLVYRPVHAPNVATTPPTITKLFYPDGIDSKQEQRSVLRSTVKRPPLPFKITRDRDRETVSAASSTPDVSAPSPRANSPTRSSESSSTRRTSTSSVPHDNCGECLSPRVVGVSSRSAKSSRPCLRSSHRPQSDDTSLAASRPPTPASVAFVASARVEDLQRVGYKCGTTNAEKASGVKPTPVYIIEMYGSAELLEPPPQLAQRPDLEPDDIFCYYRNGQDDYKVWVWVRSNGGRCSWVVGVRGMLRLSDHRRLTMHGQRPTWIAESWYSNIARNERRKAQEMRAAAQMKTENDQ